MLAAGARQRAWETRCGGGKAPGDRRSPSWVSLSHQRVPGVTTLEKGPRLVESVCAGNLGSQAEVSWDSGPSSPLNVREPARLSGAGTLATAAPGLLPSRAGFWKEHRRAWLRSINADPGPLGGFTKCFHISPLLLFTKVHRFSETYSFPLVFHVSDLGCSSELMLRACWAVVYWKPFFFLSTS